MQNPVVLFLQHPVQEKSWKDQSQVDYPDIWIKIVQ